MRQNGSSFMCCSTVIELLIILNNMQQMSICGQKIISTFIGLHVRSSKAPISKSARKASRARSGFSGDSEPRSSKYLVRNISLREIKYIKHVKQNRFLRLCAYKYSNA